MNISRRSLSQNRLMLVPLSVALLLGVLVAAALALGQSGSLTLAKVGNPVSGQIFPISLVSFQGTLNSKLAAPRAMSRDAAGNFYVIDHRSSRVMVLDSAGGVVDEWGAKGTGEQQLYRPYGISAHDSGSEVVVYVADTGNNRIKLFSAAGAYLDSWGGAGTGDGQFNLPQDITVGDTGTVYVADTDNHRVQVFSDSGAFIRSWGSQGTGDGQFMFPTGIAIGAAGEVFVADSNNHRIQVFDEDGDYLWQWGSEGSGPGQFEFPTDVAVDDEGFVLVADTFNNRVQKFTHDGLFIAQWGEAGTGNGQFQRPEGVLADAGSGLTYVLDIDNSRIEIFAQKTAMLAHGDEQTADLPAGTYDLTEATAAPWALDGVDCDGGQPTPIANGVQIELADGVAITCTFSNVSAAQTYSSYLGYIASNE